MHPGVSGVTEYTFLFLPEKSANIFLMPEKPRTIPFQQGTFRHHPDPIEKGLMNNRFLGVEMALISIAIFVKISARPSGSHI